MPSKDDIVALDSEQFALYSDKNRSSWDTSSLSSCATTVIGDDRIVDVSSCSISIASTPSRMSQTGSRPPSINSRDSYMSSYWFAHAPQKPISSKTNSVLTKDDDDSEQSQIADSLGVCKIEVPVIEQHLNTRPLKLVDAPSGHGDRQNDTYWFAQTGIEGTAESIYESACKDEKEGIKERVDEKLRMCRERQEEERQRRLNEIEMTNQQRQKYRDQLEEHRRRKIDELKTRDLERRNGVEERKKLIWEAEQNRKEAMLRRNLELETKLDAKRNSQRNLSHFVFGSSTPRNINLDMASLGPNRSNNSLLFSAAPVKPMPEPTDTVDCVKRRPVSAYFLNDNTINDIPTSYSSQMSNDISRPYYYNAIYSGQTKACLNMSDELNGPVNNALYDEYVQVTSPQILVSSVPRGRKRHSELTPALPRERDFTGSTSRINKEPIMGGNDRSVQKRAVSMTRLDQLSKPRRRYLENTMMKPNAGNTNTINTSNGMAKSMCNLTSKSTAAQRTPTVIKGMSKSMMQLTNNNKVNHKTCANPIPKCAQNPSPSLSRTKKELSKSMGNISAKTPPRQTRASKLRTENLQRLAKSSLSINDSRTRDNPVSPTRPISSMSAASSDQLDSVKMRTKPAVPKKPRPVSIAGISSVKYSENDTEKIKRESRSIEKRSAPTPALRSNRARSAGAAPPRPGLSLASPDMENKYAGAYIPKPALPKKPAHVKAAAAARKATKQTSKELISPQMEKNVIIDHEKAQSVHKPEDNDDVKSNDENKLSFEKVKESEEIKEVKALKEIPKEVKDDPKDVKELKDNESKEKSPLLANEENGGSDMSPSNSKNEISNEEYKKKLEEKRRLAREQQERDAEMERQRLEKERIEREEQLRREEEEQRRFEEEQLRLIEEHKRIEEEKLNKAIEERRMREEEENRRKEEESRMRQEKEEKERKAKEEAEKQRLELEERLKKDEEERLERKKKLEAIMSRTRKTPTNAKGSPLQSPNSTPEPTLSDSNGSSPAKSIEEVKNNQNTKMNEHFEEKLMIGSSGDAFLVPSTQAPDLVEDVNRSAIQRQLSSHVNGGSYHSNIESLGSETRLDSAVGDLLDFNGLNSVSPSQSTESSLDQLMLNLNYSSNSHSANNDDVNSNRIVPSEMIIPINNQYSNNDPNKKGHEQTLTDLLN